MGRHSVQETRVVASQVHVERRSSVRRVLVAAMLTGAVLVAYSATPTVEQPTITYSEWGK